MKKDKSSKEKLNFNPVPQDVLDIMLKRKKDIWHWSEFPTETWINLFKLHQESLQYTLAKSGKGFHVFSKVYQATHPPGFIAMTSLRLLADRDLFLKAIRYSPWIIVTDLVFQFALEILRFYCLAGRNEKLQYAKDLLGDLGLPAFIPEKTPKSRPNAFWVNA